jgi:glucose/arabinose dehydrogenase
MGLGAACARIRVVPPSQVRAVSTIAPAAASQSAANSASDAEPHTAVGQAVELTQVVSGLDEPVYLTHANDGTGAVYIVEQEGKVRVYQGGVLRATPFLDIVARVGSSANEQGLLSIAFSPTYAKDGFFFVNYTDKSGDTIVSRFTASRDRRSGDPKSELQIIKIDQPYGNHNGGLIKFGPDGMLYIGMGDGGSAGDPQNHAQNMKSLLGKMLRLDVSKTTQTQPYAIPKDNPKWQTGEKAEIWSSGLRNPWRFSFDRATGDLFIADVGQSSYEEVNFQPAKQSGDNYGWKPREGLEKYNGDKQATFTDPVVQYPHADGCSVTGGYVYRGKAIPGLLGTYLYGDYCQGTIWRLWQDSDSTWKNAVLFEDNLRIASFGEDEAGELYVVDHGGVIYKMVPAS